MGQHTSFKYYKCVHHRIENKCRDTALIVAVSSSFEFRDRQLLISSSKTRKCHLLCEVYLDSREKTLSKAFGRLL
jgi:hypothetical protein